MRKKELEPNTSGGDDLREGGKLEARPATAECWVHDRSRESGALRKAHAIVAESFDERGDARR
ncbi:MAG: hypothetical protein M3P38_06610 [Chloroflexota bacterium]|nr:hypothetical protein [Chloroflexota bacterium]